MIHFNPDTVRKIADAVTELTGGAFVFQGHGDPGDGIRYTDGIKMMTWRGPFAAERAAAYYVHAAYEWTSREQANGAPMLPPIVATALDTLDFYCSPDDGDESEQAHARANAIKEAADSGADDGENRWKARSGK